MQRLWHSSFATVNPPHQKKSLTNLESRPSLRVQTVAPLSDSTSSNPLGKTLRFGVSCKPTCVRSLCRAPTLKKMSATNDDERLQTYSSIWRPSLQCAAAAGASSSKRRVQAFDRKNSIAIMK